MRHRRERGSSLVEYAIVLTVLLTVLFAVIDFSRALYTYHFVSNAAREGTRFAIVRGSTCSGLTGGCPAAAGDVSTYLKNVPEGITPGKLTVTTTWPVQSNSPAICKTTDNAPGCTVKVDISYSFKFILPFMPTSALTMKSASEMVISQ